MINHETVNVHEQYYWKFRVYPFDNDNSLLRGLVSDDVEYVVTPDNAVLHLSVAPNIRIICLDAADGASDVCRLRSGHTKGIYTRQ